MEHISNNLNTTYLAFKEQSKQYDFFIGLADYLKYVLETIELKTIVDSAMKEKEAEYKELSKLEEQAIKELNDVKDKLLEVIRQYNISPDLLKHITTIDFDNENILETLKKYEADHSSAGIGFYSDKLANILFELAVGICNLGFKDYIKELIDPSKKSNNIYSDYYFIFSDITERRNIQAKHIDEVRKMHIWGALDYLLKFKTAFEENVTKGSSFSIQVDYGDRAKSYLDDKDEADILLMLTDLRRILEQRDDINHSIFFLKVKDYRTYASRVQNYLLNELTKLSLVNNGYNKKLKSIHLVTKSLEPQDVIFLVFDELYERPIRCPVKNSKGGATYIKKLYDIAYLVDVPGKRVDYDKNTADSINNKLFKNRAINKYMRTNKLVKPTLVQKSEDKKSLVLKHDIVVKTILVKNIPTQHQSLYIDKTK